jgi:hypothetical protein
MKDPTALRQWEPIAYFEFENELSLTFEPDCQRSYKYIFLKPTGFRKKPTSFNQNMSLAPLEIEFFGIVGSTLENSEVSAGPILAESSENSSS